MKHEIIFKELKTVVELGRIHLEYQKGRISYESKCSGHIEGEGDPSSSNLKEQGPIRQEVLGYVKTDTCMYQNNLS